MHIIFAKVVLTHIYTSQVFKFFFQVHLFHDIAPYIDNLHFFPMNILVLRLDTVYVVHQDTLCFIQASAMARLCSVC